MTMTMRKILIILAVTVFSFGLTNLSYATLVSSDLFSSGDNLLTCDTESNLEWLDLTETLNISYDDIIVSSWYTQHGFVHGTSQQVKELIEHAGGLIGGNAAANYGPAVDLIYLLGATWYRDYGTSETWNSNGVLADLYPGTDPTWFGYRRAARIVRTDVAPTSGTSWGDFLLRTGEDPYGLWQEPDKGLLTAGHFIYRVIPEPASLLLLGSGLLGLWGFKRKKRV